MPSQAQQKTLREREHAAPAYHCCILHFVALAFETTRAQPLHYDVMCAAVAKDVQDQAGLGQEGQAEPTYPSVDQVQDRKQDQVGLCVLLCRARIRQGCLVHF